MVLSANECTYIITFDLQSSSLNLNWMLSNLVNHACTGIQWMAWLVLSLGHTGQSVSSLTQLRTRPWVYYVSVSVRVHLSDFIGMAAGIGDRTRSLNVKVHVQLIVCKVTALRMLQSTRDQPSNTDVVSPKSMLK